MPRHGLPRRSASSPLAPTTLTAEPAVADRDTGYGDMRYVALMSRDFEGVGITVEQPSRMSRAVLRPTPSLSQRATATPPTSDISMNSPWDSRFETLVPRRHANVGEPGRGGAA
ncbi:hypothetical protein [Streptomyces scopuliridis]|uniref:hypothetical protein n=1 Tax=Streptomyces scopuliridis TaxID=452529 RepID=UPI003447B596